MLYVQANEAVFDRALAARQESSAGTLSIFPVLSDRCCVRQARRRQFRAAPVEQHAVRVTAAGVTPKTQNAKDDEVARLHAIGNELARLPFADEKMFFGNFYGMPL